MDFETIRYEENEGIATITFNRPNVRNAFNSQMSNDLKEIVTYIDSNSERIRVVIITGSVNTFMSGADINMAIEWTRMSRDDVREVFKNAFSPTMLERLPQPVIAAINGYAFGMGCEIALGCDFRIASDNAKFGQLEINLGIMTGEGGSVRLTRLVGKLKAMEMILTGDPIDANEAYRIGLVNEVVAPSELNDTVYKLAHKLKSRSPISLKCSKASVNRSLETGLEDAINNELELFCEVVTTEDAREGLSSFLEKRKPHFRGK